MSPASEDSPDLQKRKAELREAIRRRRAALSVHEQGIAAAHLIRNVSSVPNWPAARHITLYLAMDGEIGTEHLSDLARADGKHLLLPVVCTDKSLVFREWTENAQLTRNRFGIPEPGAGQREVPLCEIDIICLPLVAWDRSGARLGMGGGYYDRTLAALPAARRRPLVVGLAHACQELDAVPATQTDARLDYVATDRELVDCSSSG